MLLIEMRDTTAAKFWMKMMGRRRAICTRDETGERISGQTKTGYMRSGEGPRSFNVLSRDSGGDGSGR